MSRLPLWPTISVVIPAYNEERRIGASLRRIVEWLTAQEIEFEVIVVDDGSQDATVAEVLLCRPGTTIRLLRGEENRGKGAAVRRGVLAAKHEVILISDADLSTPIEELEKLYPCLVDADVVIGSRSVSDAELLKKQGPFRNLCGKIFNIIVRLLGLTSFGDTQCGFKLWRREAALKIFPLCQVDGFAFDVEALLLARRANLCIKEVGVIWRNSPESKVRVVTDSLSMFIDVLRIRYRVGADQNSEINISDNG